VKSTRKVRRQIFVLTPEEKRAVCFVLIAFVLGLGVKHYRTTHGAPASRTEVKASANRLQTKRPKETK
jgi:hypothetical protein